MSIFNLPAVTYPHIKQRPNPAVEGSINQSLLEYIEQLKHIKVENYNKLNTVCGLEETLSFYKYVEVFNNFPWQREKLNVCSIQENDDAKKALTLVRGGVDNYDALVENADLVVADTTTHISDMYTSVKNVLSKQKLDGNLVLHVGDLFGECTVQLLYLISACYTSMYIYTPMLHTGQTKFVVATKLCHHVELALPPPYTFHPTQYFLTKLIEINTIIGQKRLEQTRFNTTSDYECVIWKSKFLSTFHNVNVDADRRGYQVYERPKTPHSNTVD
jgi:hypothetical protein